MSLTDQLRKDMFEAVKAGDSISSGIIQLVLASLKNLEIQKGEPLTETELSNALFKEEKKLKEAIEIYSANGRADLADKEKKQLDTLQKYLPKRMTEEEVEVVVKKAVEATGARDIKDMGRVISAVMKELEGKVDGSTVSSVVKKVLMA